MNLIYGRVKISLFPVLGFYMHKQIVIIIIIIINVVVVKNVFTLPRIICKNDFDFDFTDSLD